MRDDIRFFLEAMFQKHFLKIPAAHFLLFFSLTTAVAASDTSSITAQSLFKNIMTLILNPIMNFLLVFATLVFLWGVMQYALAVDSPDKAKSAKKQIVWGIVGLAIMSSAKVIVSILEATLK